MAILLTPAKSPRGKQQLVIVSTSKKGKSRMSTVVKTSPRKRLVFTTPKKKSAPRIKVLSTGKKTPRGAKLVVVTPAKTRRSKKSKRRSGVKHISRRKYDEMYTTVIRRNADGSITRYSRRRPKNSQPRQIIYVHENDSFDSDSNTDSDSDYTSDSDVEKKSVRRKMSSKCFGIPKRRKYNLCDRVNGKDKYNCQKIRSSYVNAKRSGKGGVADRIIELAKKSGCDIELIKK